MKLKRRTWIILILIALSVGLNVNTYYMRVWRFFCKAEFKGMNLLGTYECIGYDNSALSINVDRWRDGRTSMNIKTHVGVIASDPRWIPTGSTVYVQGVGYMFVCDVGSAIKNKKLDIFFWNSVDARKWGRRRRKVWLVKIR